MSNLRCPKCGGPFLASPDNKLWECLDCSHTFSPGTDGIRIWCPACGYECDKRETLASHQCPKEPSARPPRAGISMAIVQWADVAYQAELSERGALLFRNGLLEMHLTPSQFLVLYACPGVTVEEMDS